MLCQQNLLWQVTIVIDWRMKTPLTRSKHPRDCEKFSFFPRLYSFGSTYINMYIRLCPSATALHRKRGKANRQTQRRVHSIRTPLVYSLVFSHNLRLFLCLALSLFFSRLSVSRLLHIGQRLQPHTINNTECKLQGVLYSSTPGRMYRK